jgi:tetratricopeptide (TPR) repeat protein
MTKILKYLSIFLIFVLSGCIKDPPGFAEYNVGVGLFQAGDYEGAIGHFQNAVEENPSFAEAFMNLGTSLYRTERFTEAMAAYEKADSLFRTGEYVDVRGAHNEEKVTALHEMMEITDAQIRLLDSDNLTEAEIEELRRIVEPLTE